MHFQEQIVYEGQGLPVLCSPETSGTTEPMTHHKRLVSSVTLLSKRQGLHYTTLFLTNS